MDGSLTIFCTSRGNRPINISNAELYLIYSIIFIVTNIVILKIVKKTTSKVSLNKYLLFSVCAIQLLGSTILLTIYVQITFYSYYYNNYVILIVFASLLSSIGFLSILTIKLFGWFSRVRDRLILIYGITMLLFILNTVIGLMYLTQILSTHPEVIKAASCRAIYGSFYNINPTLSINLSKTYDFTSIVCFILAWSATTIMLRQYSLKVGKIRYWFLVSIPLVFFMSKYEILFYYFLSNSALLDIFSINSYSSSNVLLSIILRSNLQFGGVFFAIVFLVIASKIPKGHQIVNSLLISLMGMMFIFGSKDISALTLATLPPVGIVSISFMGIASYLLLMGMYSISKISSRDTNLRKYISQKVEKDTTLLMNIGLSEKESEIEKNIKPLIDYSVQWQEEHKEHDISQHEIKAIVSDMVSQIRENIKKEEKKRKNV